MFDLLRIRADAIFALCLSASPGGTSRKGSSGVRPALRIWRKSQRIDTGPGKDLCSGFLLSGR